MIKNYRNLGSTRTSYLSALGSGKSQGSSETLVTPVVDTLNITFGLAFMLHEVINYEIEENIES